MQSQRFLTETEVAEDLKKKRGTLANWRCQGKGPAYVKVGRSVMYPEPDYNKWKARLRRRAGKQ